MARPAAVRTTPRRIWLYPRGQWDGPLLMRGSDEYGRLTLVLHVPGLPAVVWAYRWCNDPACCERCTVTGFPHSAWINGVPDCGCVPEVMAQAWAGVVEDCGCPDVYWCSVSGEIECVRHGGFGACCSAPLLHIPARRHELAAYWDRALNRLAEDDRG